MVPNLLPWVPQGIAQVRDQRLDFIGGRVRRQVDVDLWTGFGTAWSPRDAVTHGPADEEHPFTGGLETLGNWSCRLENRPKSLGNKRRRGWFPAHLVNAARWYRPAVAITSRAVVVVSPREAVSGL